MQQTMADIPPANQQPANNIILKLKSKDGEVFDVEKPVAMQINFVKGMLEDVDEIDGMEIPMGEVDACILAKVVEFCKFHHQQEINQTSADEIDRWEKSFVQVDKSTLFQLILVCFLTSHLVFIYVYLHMQACHVPSADLCSIVFSLPCRLRTF